jgi:hypothetical protein
MQRATFVIRDFAVADQEVVRWLIIEGLGEHWGSIDLSLNQDLNDIVRTGEDVGR